MTYNQSLSLVTDLYQITMAYGYWKSNNMDKESVFHLYFRNNPFQGGFTISCGLEYVVDYLENFKFDQSDVDYLATLTGNDDKPLFEKGFLDYLVALDFACDVDAIPEGTVVFPNEPLLRIKGPLIQCQLLETALLNIINFQTLIATKASRVVLAARKEPVLEFGLRRAQGIDGGLSASRAAYIGGCTATSNVFAGKIFGIPVKGTHAHSWIMSFDTELEAMQTYAKSMPNNCVFLVDTYDTVQGVKNAVKVGKTLKKNGFKMAGIRLDSGDLAYLSGEARKILDDNGFQDVSIVASNDLDENIINSLKEQDAKINVWGVGTKLVTAFDQPALGGVYKLSAIREKDGEWQQKIKLSEQSIKVSNPGIQQVRRFSAKSENMGDMIYDITSNIGDEPTMIDPLDSTRRKVFTKDTDYVDLLVPIFREGKKVYNLPDINSIRDITTKNLDKFYSGVRRFVNPHQYTVGLEQSLYEVKNALIMKLRQKK
ncbi:MAG: nicotinate phosphoribosyltransferase [Candidatus Sericytochromatia bacterium]|nr:nicotinate phosphoribosyltransferase [Candidatus Sericytochromatia bacterium]